MRPRLLVSSVMIVLVGLLIGGLTASEVVLSKQSTSPVTTGEKGVTTADQVPTDTASPVQDTDLTVDENLTAVEDLAVWDRENRYMVQQQNERQEKAPLPLGNHVDSPEDRAEGAQRVLVVGDSFVWGFGQYDLDRVWHRVTATELSRKFGAGAYHFLPIGTYGTSMLSYAEYLSSEQLDRYDPDVIVIGFVANDWIPDGTIEKICGANSGDGIAACPKGMQALLRTGQRSEMDIERLGGDDYVNCMTGRGGIISKMTTKFLGPLFPRTTRAILRNICDRYGYAGATGTERLDDLNDVEASPYWPLFLDAIETIVENAGDTPVLVLPTEVGGKGAQEHSELVLSALREGGMTLVPTPRSDALNERQWESRSELWVNPADSHPNSFLSQAYGMDLYDFIAKKYPSRPGSASKERRSLLSNFVPSSLVVEPGREGSVTVSHDPESRRSEDQAITSDYWGNAAEPQNAPCATLGRPFAQVVLNPQVLDEPVKVRLVVEEMGAPAMVLSQMTYDEDGRLSYRKAMVVRSGDRVTLWFDRNTTGFVLAAPRSGCEQDEPILLPGFKLSIEDLT
jgi:hypothetical protein